MGLETQISSKTWHELNFMLNFLLVHWPKKLTFVTLVPIVVIFACLSLCLHHNHLHHLFSLHLQHLDHLGLHHSKFCLFLAITNSPTTSYVSLPYAIYVCKSLIVAFEALQRFATIWRSPFLQALKLTNF